MSPTGSPLEHKGPDWRLENLQELKPRGSLSLDIEVYSQATLPDHFLPPDCGYNVTSSLQLPSPPMESNI